MVAGDEIETALNSSKEDDSGSQQTSEISVDSLFG